MTINLFSWFELVEYNHRQEFRIDMRREVWPANGKTFLLALRR